MESFQLYLSFSRWRCVYLLAIHLVVSRGLMSRFIVGWVEYRILAVGFALRII